MNKLIRPSINLVLPLLMLLALSSVALACPTCKDNLAADPDAANLVRGYFYSILFMMAMPFTILTALSLMFYLEVRKAKARRVKEVAASSSATAVIATQAAEPSTKLASVS